MRLILVTVTALICADALQLAAHLCATGCTAVGARTSCTTMQHSKGWDDFGKPSVSMCKSIRPRDACTALGG